MGNILSCTYIESVEVADEYLMKCMMHGGILLHLGTFDLLK